MQKRNHLGEEHFISARRATQEYINTHLIRDHMFHGPVAAQYYSEPFRIVAINMESYGYDGINTVDFETLRDWLYDRGNTNTKTVRYTLTLLTGILSCLNANTPIKINEWAAFYQDGALLESTMRRTAYYNIRPESNIAIAQNVAAISASGSSALGRCIWNEVLALDPDIVFISGHAGLKAVNSLIRPMQAISYSEQAIYESGFLIISIPHPSRPDYKHWSLVTERINSAA